MQYYLGHRLSLPLASTDVLMRFDRCFCIRCAVDMTTQQNVCIGPTKRQHWIYTLGLLRRCGMLTSLVA